MNIESAGLCIGSKLERQRGSMAEMVGIVYRFWQLKQNRRTAVPISSRHDLNIPSNLGFCAMTV